MSAPWRVGVVCTDLAFAAALVALAAILGLGLVKPRFDALAEDRAAVAALREYDERADAARQALAGLDVQRGNLARATEGRVVLHSLARRNERFRRLSELAAGLTDLRIDQVTQGEPRLAMKHATVAARLTGASTYPALQRFLERVHREFPDVAVVGFSVVKGAGAAPVEPDDPPGAGDSAAARRGPGGSAPPDGVLAHAAAFTLDLVWYAQRPAGGPGGGPGSGPGGRPAGGATAGQAGQEGRP